LGANRPNAFSKDEIEIANEVGDLLAISVHQAELYQKLELSNARLERALQAKEEMIQNVSHELRTPLQILKGYSSLMREGSFGDLTDDQTEAIDVIAGRLDQLNFLVTRLLTLQALDRRVLDFQQLDMEDLLTKLTNSWRLRADNQGLNLALETAAELPRVTADPNLLNLAVGNLVDNAIKFSRDTNGTVTVRTWADKGELFISVTDPGIGIPEDKLEEIFERFVQVDGSTTRTFGGMGIGLALSHDIVVAHGGRLWAESEGKGRGSTLFIALPANNK
jgi:signal transduction histidine kinase